MIYNHCKNHYSARKLDLKKTQIQAGYNVNNNLVLKELKT